MATWLDDYFDSPRTVGMRLGATTPTFGHEMDEPRFYYYLQANMVYFPRLVQSNPPWGIWAARYATRNIQVEKEIDLVNPGFQLSDRIKSVAIVEDFGSGYLVSVNDNAGSTFAPNLATDQRLSGLDSGGWHYDLVFSTPFPDP
jgi:hypothetical protein